MPQPRDDHLTAEQLQARADAIQAMLHDNTGWPYVRAELEEQIAALSARILAGKLDHEEYLRLAGILHGLETALALPDRLIVRSPVQTEEPT